MPKVKLVAGAAALAAMAVFYGYYRRIRRDTLRRLRAGSRVAVTSRGPLEYAAVGAGPAVLVFPGTGAGYEQGLLLSRLIDPEKLTWLALSRPGFRQTPLSTGSSPEQQADAACELLDLLKIGKAAILASSGGAPAALQLALRHPECCRALILISPALPPVGSDQVSPRTLASLRVMAGIPDILLWFLYAPFRLTRVMIDSSSTGGPVLLKDPQAIDILRETIFSSWPQRDLKAGILNDIEQIQSLQPYPLDRVRIPTLIIHGLEDSTVPVGLARHAARTIPGAQSLFLPGASHMVFATHAGIISRRIRQFLEELQ